MEPELEIPNLVNCFFLALDDRDYDTCCALFHLDGTWYRQGAVLTGPAMIGKALAQRPAEMVVRHVITNLVIRALSADSATVGFYSTVYSTRGAATSGLPPVPPPAMLAVYTAELVRFGREWLFISLRSKPIFSNMS